MPDIQSLFKDAWSNALAGVNTAEQEAEKVLTRIADAAGFSAEDVRREVRRLAGIAGRSRRCFLMPSNRIQPETPWDNIVAFAEEARLLVPPRTLR